MTVMTCGHRALAASALTALWLVSACTSDPPPDMISRSDQSNMPPTAPPGPGTGGIAPPSTPPPTSPPLVTGGTGGAGGNGMPAGGSSGGAPIDAGSDAGADAGPELTMCADEDAGAALGDEAITCLAVGDLHVQYKAADASATDQQIKPHFNLVNVGAEPVPLSELTVRYWYTRDTTAVQEFACDYAVIGCGVISGAFTAVERVGADHYFELSFASGTLGAGAQTGEIQVRFNNVGWAAYDESSDYSYEPGHTAFADWYKTTLYRRGQLVWGAEPPDVP